MVLDIGRPGARLDWVGILPCRKIARAKGPPRHGTTWWYRIHRPDPAPRDVLYDAVNNMMVCAAGEAAVAHLHGRRSFQLDGADAEEFHQTAFIVCQGDHAELLAFSRWVLRRTASQVRARWPEIQAVARSLLEHSELNAEEAAACVRGLLDKPASLPAAPVAAAAE